MWRLWVLALVGPVWAEGDLGEEDAGYLEQRLDDLGGIDAMAVRWRVRGAEAAWERLQLYQRGGGRAGWRTGVFWLGRARRRRVWVERL